MSAKNNVVFSKVNTFDMVDVEPDGSVSFRADYSTNNRQLYNRIYENVDILNYDKRYDKELNEGIFRDPGSYLIITVGKEKITIKKMWQSADNVYMDAEVEFRVYPEEIKGIRRISSLPDYDITPIVKYGTEIWSFLRNVMEVIRRGEFTQKAWDEWKLARYPGNEKCKNCGESFDKVKFGTNLYVYYTGSISASLCRNCEIGKNENSPRWTRKLTIEVTQDMVTMNGYHDKGDHVEYTHETKVSIDSGYAVFNNKGKCVDSNVHEDSMAYQDIYLEYDKFTNPEDYVSSD